MPGIWRFFDGADGVVPDLGPIVQDRNRTIWAVSSRDLLRFDGGRFALVPIDVPETVNNLTALYSDNNNVLWAGASNGRLYTYDGRRFTSYGRDEGLTEGSIWVFFPDQAGNMWVGTKKGLRRWDGKRFVCPDGPKELGDCDVHAVTEDSEGRLWIGTWGDGLYCQHDGKWTHFGTEDGVPSNIVRAIACDPCDNGLWLGTIGGGICHFDGNRTFTPLDREGIPRDVHLVFLDSAQRLWFSGVPAAFGYVADDKLTDCLHCLTTQGVEPEHWVRGLTEDDDGQIWCAFTEVRCYAPGPVEVLHRELIRRYVGVTARGCWFEGLEGLSCLTKAEGIQQHPALGGVQAVHQSADGRVFCLRDSPGVWLHDNEEAFLGGHGRFVPFETECPIEHAAQLREMPDGSLWVTSADPAHAYRFQRDLPERIPTPEAHMLTCFVDSEGRLWVGDLLGGDYISEGVWCQEGGIWRHYTTEDGLASNTIADIAETRDGTIWVATWRGVCRFDGQGFQLLEELSYLPTRRITPMSDGTVWFSTANAGAFCHDGQHTQQLTTEDGLPSNAVLAIVEESSGDYLLVTDSGVARYSKGEQKPASARVIRVVADRPYDAPLQITCEAEVVSSIRITHAAISPSTRRVQFSYMLEGYDAHWHHTWDRYVEYHHVPPGRYTYRVYAVNRDLVPSDKPAEVKIVLTGTAKATGQRSGEQTVAAALRIIDETQGNIEVKELVERLCMSPSTLRRLFSRHCDCSAKERIIQARIDRAKDMLRDRSRTISDVAEACGFNSIWYFSRRFKLATGKTPTEFRQDPAHTNR